MTNTQYKKRIRLKGFNYIGCYRYSLTFCTREKAAYFTGGDTVSNTASILREAAEKHNFKIWTVCFMPDHLHILVEGKTPASDLKKFASYFKQKSGFWFRQTRGVDLWQINYYEHVLRSDEVTEKVARYILENPVRKGIATDYRVYPYSQCDVFGSVGQGFSLADNATLKGCPTKDRTPQPNGFTLIEIVLTIVLIGIVSGIAAVIIMQGTQSASSVKSLGEAHEQARFALDRMSRELLLIRSRAAAPVDDIITMTATALEYNSISGARTGFRLSGNTLERYDGSWQMLATGITAPGGALFTYLDANGDPGAVQATLWSIQVGLIATQGQESLTLRTTVHPRNF